MRIQNKHPMLRPMKACPVECGCGGHTQSGFAAIIWFCGKNLHLIIGRLQKPSVIVELTSKCEAINISESAQLGLALRILICPPLQSCASQSE